MMHLSFRMGLVLLLLLTGGAVHAQGAADSMGVLRPGDGIRILVPEDEQVSGTFMIDERGIVMLPKLGPRQVAGTNGALVRDRIAAEYASVLPASLVAIEVTVLRRVLVRGEVREPGSYLLATYEATVGDALAAAGGVTPDGRTDRLLLVRADSATLIRLDRSTRLAGLMLQSGDELVVQPRSWWLRNQAVLPTLVSGAVSLLVTVLIVGMQ